MIYVVTEHGDTMDFVQGTDIPVPYMGLLSAFTDMDEAFNYAHTQYNEKIQCWGIKIKVFKIVPGYEPSLVYQVGE